jgi:hypothetical protein
VYDKVTTTPPSDQAGGENVAQITTPAFSSTPSIGDDFAMGNLFPLSDCDPDTDRALIDIDWDVLGDISTQTLKNDFPRLNEPAPKVTSNGPFLFNNSDDRHVDGVPVNVDPQNIFQLPELPSTALTIRNENSSALSARTQRYERRDSNFLARLPISEPVSQFIATSVIEMIRTYPLMMLRTESLPSFIHGHWYLPSNTTHSSLPEPLVNCMGIAQIFASHNTESKPYLWNLVKMEQRSFIEKVQPLSTIGRLGIYIYTVYIPRALGPIMRDMTRSKSYSMLTFMYQLANMVNRTSITNSPETTFSQLYKPKLCILLCGSLMTRKRTRV